MSALERFVQWAESNGADIVILQEDDGSGFTVIEVEFEVGKPIEVSVNEVSVNEGSMFNGGVS